MISATLYTNIACMIELLDTRYTDMDTELDSMIDILADTDASATRIIKLEQQINKTLGAIADNQTSTPQYVLDAVKALQQHVTRLYGSVNSFLTANGIKVPQHFADVSAEAGYTILAANIIPSCE